MGLLSRFLYREQSDEGINWRYRAKPKSARHKLLNHAIRYNKMSHERAVSLVGHNGVRRWQEVVRVFKKNDIDFDYRWKEGKGSDYKEWYFVGNGRVRAKALLPRI